MNEHKHKLAIFGTTTSDKKGLVTTKMLIKKILKLKITLIVISEQRINKCVVGNIANGISVLILRNINNCEETINTYPNTKFEIIISEVYQNSMNKRKYEFYSLITGLMDDVIICSINVRWWNLIGLWH
ncbi:hypothetical protein [Spiroplasma endosymbiont of Polydrusus formosus]|uniref:hypothetical protein n=1 Tax=Spiroplasma endosymbiont of Polydrusus formosus TaxID=3139326 RepID=UPI0035B56992